MTTALPDETVNRIANSLREAYHGDLSDCPVLLDGAEALLTLKDEREQLADRLVITKERCKQKLAAQAAKAEAEFHAMTVEMRGANVARVIEATGVDIVTLANRCERVEKERDDLREALKIYQKGATP